ncbi:hypothetical protein [Oribacterium sinus]|uniref:Uncharacterized protein n=1 Tax=Oribacterium sinus F0268 TaxID=585501 RepID=C2KXB9_9FIRM|nr:hypothetical protein [Oribacterium sinus]EEJ51599.1 hypothetical protein HMPREF6123_1138 [Oribacterium sinus F0268]
MAQDTFNISVNEAPVTREGAMQAFTALRAQAKANDVVDMSLKDINEEISLARRETEE